MFDLDLELLERAARHTDRGIVLGSLLSSVARQELFRFKEFITWLRFGTADHFCLLPFTHELIRSNQRPSDPEWSTRSEPYLTSRYPRGEQLPCVWACVEQD